MKNSRSRSPLITAAGFLIGLLGMSGCSPPPTATLPPSPQTLTVALPLALSPIQDALQTCANTQADLLVNLLELPNRPPEPEAADLSIWFGEPPEAFEYAVQLAEENLAVIVHPSNPVNELDGAQLRAIFSGQIRSWSDLDGEARDIQVWVYPEGNQVRELFENPLLSETDTTSLAKLAPTAEAMLAGVAEDPASIGYAPQAVVGAAVRQVKVDEELSEALRMPVLGLAPDEPRGAARDFLVCLQGGEGQARIAEYYALKIRE